MEPTFFSTPEAFRQWLERNHESETELIVGFYKKASGIPSMTWPESVEQALCFGWIDGIRRSLDDTSYTIRFTPRKKKSTWSAVNIKMVKALIKSGLMHPAGIAAYKRREERNSEIYSFEQGKIALDPESEKAIKANKQAWEFFESLAPSAKKATVWWIVQAKREETKQRRLKVLIESSEQGLKIPMLRRMGR